MKISISTDDPKGIRKGMTTGILEINEIN